MTPVVLRSLRDRLSFTQEQMSHEIGITVSTWNRWENGHSSPSKLAMKAIRAFAASKGLIMDGQE